MTDKNLYNEALECAQKYREFELERYNEQVSILKASIDGWWKPIIILDDRDKTATWFMKPGTTTLGCITTADIDWESMKGLDAECINRAENLDAHFPTNIRGFRNGVAEVEWQLNPDGRYYMDDDGFGMTDDEEVSLFSYIDRHGRILCKFTYVGSDYSKLQSLRAQAEKKVK